MTNQTVHDALMNLPLPFLGRLCRENGWSKQHGLRAILEYKRFIYLAAISPDPVTPSDAVDRVWHLHLIHTRSYWEDLCGAILGRPLHHGPTDGGPVEDAKFENWYERTKALYSNEFANRPPADLWPPGAERFDKTQRFRWLDTSRHWLIPKPSWKSGAASPSVFALFTFGSDATFPLLMAGGAIAAVLIALINADREPREREPRKRQSGDGGADGAYFGDSSDSGCHDSNGPGSCGDDASSGCSTGCGGGGCGGGD